MDSEYCSIYKERHECTVLHNKPIDSDGNYIPWLIYSVTDFITSLPKHFKVFEYGCGFSTIYYSNIFHDVHFVEHREKWFNFINENINKNKAKGYSIQIPEDYISSIERSGIKYNIIIIDGMYRKQCLMHAINFLHKNGVIIFDNSDRESYKGIFNTMESLGFTCYSPRGLAPVDSEIKQCTIFIKI